jgi:hypothetical protein
LASWPPRARTAGALAEGPRPQPATSRGHSAYDAYLPASRQSGGGSGGEDPLLGEIAPRRSTPTAHLAVTPGDRRTRPSCEGPPRAERCDESVAEFERLLADSPADREPLLGSRVQSGQELPRRSRREKLMEPTPRRGARRARPDCLPGQATCRGGEAMDAALAVSPENAGALLGKAQVAH